MIELEFAAEIALATKIEDYIIIRLYNYNYSSI